MTSAHYSRSEILWLLNVNSPGTLHVSISSANDIGVPWLNGFFYSYDVKPREMESYSLDPV